jgi:uncharacterized protein (TIGR00725 family)
MASKIIIGVMGPGEGATPEQNELAYDMGKAIASEGWAVLTGGRAFGVMDAAMKGAKEKDGLTIGVLAWNNDKGSSPYADIKIITGIGASRNQINVLSSNVIVVIGMSSGTASEVSLAIKADKRIILLQQDELTSQFFHLIGSHRVVETNTVEQTLECIKKFLAVNR